VTARVTPLIADRPLLGILLMLGFCALAPLGDSVAKILGGTIPLLQLILVRFAMQAALLIPLIVAQGGTLAMSPRVLRLTALRTVLHILGVGAMFTALRYLPLADAIAIAFVMPFIMLLLGKLVLGEEVGPRRLIACAVGFAGTLMVIQPSFAAVGPPALLPVAVAVIFALYMLISRQVAKDADPLVLQAVSGLIATAVLLPAAAVLAPFGLPGTGFVLPGAGDTALLLLLGTIGTVAHLLMTWSLRFAPSATVAPMQYLEIPFATLIGWLIFGDLPNGLAAAGIAVTMAAGLYIVLREHAVGRRHANR
jgi:drug/metabolite transporter (DMT)-like permease